MVSFGRIGLAIAGGLAEGASEVIDENQKKAEKEIERRDRLFQQAMRYADEDKTKYEKARADKSEMLSLALEDVRSMGLADDSQTQMVLAANMVKEAGSKEALTKRLEDIRADFKVDPEMVKGGYTPLTSKLDKETLRNVTFDTLTEQLVPSYQRGKGLGAYYQPSPYEGSGLFKDVGRKDIARQEEQFKQTAEAFGLGKRDVGELPSMGALPSGRRGVTEADSSTNLRALGFAKLAQAERSADPEAAKALIEEGNSLIDRANKMDVSKKEATTTERSRIAQTPQGYQASFGKASADPKTWQNRDTSMKIVLGIEGESSVVGAAAKQTTYYQSVYDSAITAANMTGVDNEAMLQNIGIALGKAGNILEDPKIVEATRYRAGKAQPLNEYLKTLKGMDANSETFKALPKDVQKLSVFLRDNDRKSALKKQTYFKTKLLDPLLKNGYFVTESSLRSYNPMVVWDSVFGSPVQTGTPPPPPPPPPSNSNKKPTEPNKFKGSKRQRNFK